MEIFTEERRNKRKQNMCPGTHARLAIAALMEHLMKIHPDMSDKESRIANYFSMNIVMNTAAGYCGCESCLKLAREIEEHVREVGYHAHIVTKESDSASACDIDCDHEPMH